MRAEQRPLHKEQLLNHWIPACARMTSTLAKGTAPEAMGRAQSASPEPVLHGQDGRATRSRIGGRNREHPFNGAALQRVEE